MNSVGVGKLMTNCYVVDEGTGGVVVIDPGGEADKILKLVGDRPIRLILVTHWHGDHVGALEELLPKSEGGWMIGAIDYPMLCEGRPDFPPSSVPTPIVSQPPARLLQDGDIIEVGNMRLRVMLTPGHTPGSVCYIDDAKHAAYTGDTLFAGSCGRTDLFGGDVDAMKASLVLLSKLPEQTQVMPGHGRTGVIAHELLGNAMMRRALGLI